MRATLGALLVVPMIGASWGGYRSANRFDGSVVGGIVGAIIQSSSLMAYCWYLNFSVSMDDLESFGGTIFVLLAVSVFLGSIAGLLVGIVFYRVCVVDEGVSRFGTERCNSPA